MNNYSITTATAQLSAGDSLNTTSINLTITADSGYTVSAGDFSIGTANPDVYTVLFTDNGDGTVNALVIFSSSAVMPAGNKEVLIDIDGVAYPEEFILRGNIDVNTTNSVQASSNTIFAVQGAAGEEVLVATVDLDANPGYTYSDPGSLLILVDPGNANVDNYRIEQVTPSTAEVTYNIYYTFTAEDISGDSITIVANAVEEFVPSETYHSYIFYSESTQNGSGAYQYPYSPEQLDITVFGTGDASVTVTLADTTNATVLDTQTKLISDGTSSTQTKFIFNLPEVVVDTDYTITFTGDKDPGFSQTDPIVINQRALDTIVTYSFTPVSGYNIVQVPIPVSISGEEGTVDSVEQINTTKNITYKITSTTPGQSVGINAAADFLQDFTNSNSLLNGGTQFIAGVPLVSGEDTTELIVTYSITVTYFGSNNITCSLDLTSKLI